MKSLMKLGMIFLGILFLMVPAFSKADDSPIPGGGNFGLGLELGDPGAWGASGKIWVDKNNAFQPALKLGDGTTILQLDYLWHTYDIIHPKNGLLPVYFGIGGDLSLENVVTVGVRGVVGISYMFDKKNVPVDIFVQLAPTLWFYSGATQFDVYGELGSRYYF